MKALGLTARTDLQISTLSFLKNEQAPRGRDRAIQTRITFPVLFAGSPKAKGRERNAKSSVAESRHPRNPHAFHRLRSSFVRPQIRAVDLDGRRACRPVSSLYKVCSALPSSKKAISVRTQHYSQAKVLLDSCGGVDRTRRRKAEAKGCLQSASCSVKEVELTTRQSLSRYSSRPARFKKPSASVLPQFLTGRRESERRVGAERASLADALRRNL